MWSRCKTQIIYSSLFFAPNLKIDYFSIFKNTNLPTMIKFFRKIRYTLMEQNKTRKYFKYAMGEILLVVLGILIALQINNWNENRKKEILKSEYIIALINDYTKDSIQINARLLKTLQDIKSQLTFLDVYQTYMVDSFHNLISPFTMKNLKFSEENNTVELTKREHLIDNLELTNLLNLKLETDKGSSERLKKIVNTMDELKSEIKSELNNK